ncbi:MAG: discoidin domain-containing protein [Bacteroidota bacterium]
MNTLIAYKKIATVVFLTFFILTNISCEQDMVTPDPDLLPPVALDRTGWEIIDYSTQEDNDGEGAYPNGRCVAILDGNPDTFWHSCWNGCSPTTPHFIVVDMLNESQVSGFFLMQRQSLSRNIENCEIFISNDNQNWESLGEFALEKIKVQQDLALPETKTFRYFKFVVKSVFDGTGNAALAELSPYTLDF